MRNWTIGALIIGLLALWGAFYFSSGTVGIASEASHATSTGELGATYRNTHFHFSFARPENVTITEFDEAGPSQTIVVETKDESHGFQVYALPYAESTISNARFRMDVPSGVRKGEAKALLGGVEAVAFESVDALLGDTREVWVMHGGYLYEVTARKADEEWLYEVLKTWEFI